MELQSYIRDLCDKGENTEVEFKSAKGGFPGSLWETYSAFANTNGGIIVLGIAEKKHKFFPDGLDKETVTKYKKLFWDGANNQNTVNACVVSDSDVFEAKYKGSYVLIIKIPRVEYSMRPIYQTLNLFGGHVYVRRHEGDYKIDDASVRRMLADSMVAETPLDKRLFPHCKFVEGIDPNTVRQYRQIFDSHNDKHPWTELQDMQFLEKIGAYRMDDKSSEEGFTLAGILMFGTQKGLEDAMPYYFIDYREKLSDDPAIRWTDRVYPDGYWEPNLFQFFSRVYPKIRQALPVPFKMEGAVRIDYTPAHKALREAIVNCLVHACYGLMHNIVIERYPDKLVFRNPGTMLIPVEKFFAGGTSICRNAYLQKMFSFIGYVERAGSGADTILQGWKENNWPKPQIRELYDPDEVELTLYFKSPDTGNELKVDTNGATKSDTNKLTDRQRLIYNIIATADTNNDTNNDTNASAATSASIAAAVNVSLSTVKRELDKMKDMGVIKRVGPTFGGHWEIIKK